MFYIENKFNIDFLKGVMERKHIFKKTPRPQDMFLKHMKI